MKKNIFILVAILIPGCAKTMAAGKISDTTMTERKQLNDLRSRAAFELKCDDLKFTALKDMYFSEGYLAQIGVDGCGDRNVYMFTDSGWVLNSESSSQSK